MGLTPLLSLRSFCLAAAARKWQLLILWRVRTGVYLPGVCHPLKSTSVTRAERVPRDVPGPGTGLGMLDVLPEECSQGTEGSGLAIGSARAVVVCP